MEQVLDDLELFELKTFALCSEEIRGLVEEWRIVLLPELEPVVRLLDPEGNRIPHFYIYSILAANCGIMSIIELIPLILNLSNSI